jgi:glycosyltransferase involved in cell wall biosynthesis
MTRKLPVIIAGTNCLSGVTSWADQLREAFADHPRYDVQSLYVGPEPTENADLAARTLDDAHALVCQMAPAILIPNYVWDLYLAGLEKGVRCVGMCHADNEEQYYRPLGWYEPVIAKFIGVSQECADQLAGRIPSRSHDIAMLPYGVRIPPALDRTYETRPLRLIYAGRVTQLQKRVWDFMPLVENLLRAKVPFEFNIIGEGDEFAPLQQIMRTRIPAADVQFHPRIAHREMAAKWLEHDIFLQVSDFEGTSVSMLEAMAHGVVPVVTAASSGITGVISSQKNGFVVPIGDMAAMAGVLAQLATDGSLLASAGRAAYRTAQAYAMDLYVQKFARILDEVASADGNVDYQKRYGIYSPTHPLLVQRERIEREQMERERGQELAFKRILKQGIKGFRRSKSRDGSRNDRRAA